MLKLYIPTLNRVGHQTTYKNLPRKWQKRTVLVVGKEEAKAHGDIPTLVTPAKGIGKVRQWIIEQHSGDKLAMLDDDLRFDVRRNDDRTKFKPATEDDVDQMFSALEEMLSPKIPHGGVTAREGGNRHVDDWLECTRMLRVLAYHVPTFRKAGADYARLKVMEDFDVTLQLLRMGYPNRLLNNWVQGQSMSGAPGGCSTYRTLDVQKAGAEGLHKLHGDFVKLVEKTTKTAWGGATRTDVMVFWKKAYESSRG
jgi:hypothetical protein